MGCWKLARSWKLWSREQFAMIFLRSLILTPLNQMFSLFFFIFSFFTDNNLQVLNSVLLHS